VATVIVDGMRVARGTARSLLWLSDECLSFEATRNTYGVVKMKFGFFFFIFLFELNDGKVIQQGW
jgi:hypothetical protein